MDHHSSYDDRPRVKDGTTIWERELDDIVRTLVYSPQGDFVAAGTVADQKVVLLDAKPTFAGRTIWSRAVDGQVESMDYHPLGEVIAIGTGRYKVTAAEATTGNTIWEKRFLGSVMGLAYSPTGEYLAAGLGVTQKRVMLLDAKNGTILWHNELKDSVTSLAFYPTAHHQKGSHLAIATANDQCVSLMNASPTMPAKLWKLELEGKVEAVAFAADGRVIAAGAGQKLVIIEEMTGCVEWTRRLAFTGGVQSVCFSPSSRHVVASTGSDKKITVLDVRSGHTVWDKEIDSQNIMVAFAPSGDHIAVGTSHFRVIVMSARNLNLAVKATKEEDPNHFSKLLQKRGMSKGGDPDSRSGSRPGTQGNPGLGPIERRNSNSTLLVAGPGAGAGAAAGLAFPASPSGKRPGSQVGSRGSRRPGTVDTLGSSSFAAPSWVGAPDVDRRPSVLDFSVGKSGIWLKDPELRRGQPLTRSTPILLGIPGDRREDWGKTYSLKERGMGANLKREKQVSLNSDFYREQEKLQKAMRAGQEPAIRELGRRRPPPELRQTSSSGFLQTPPAINSRGF